MGKSKDIIGINERLIANNLTAFAQNKTPDTSVVSATVAEVPQAPMVWCAIQFLTDTTCAEIKEMVEGVSTAVTALALAYKAGAIIYGQFTSIKGDGTGCIRRYYYSPIA